MNKKLDQAIALFMEQKYEEAVELFVSLYNQGTDQKKIYDILSEALYEPNKIELQQNYEQNLALLKKYPYFFSKEFPKISEITFLLFPISDHLFYCFDPNKNYFFGKYDAKSRYQMRYFFEKLDQPLLVENEDNAYNLEFLNETVRSSENVGKDNHIYLYYSEIESLQRLMLTCDLKAVLQQKKFVFLIGETYFKNYPINFKKRYNIDYSKMLPKPLQIEEINRIYLNEFYAYSGTDFFEGVINGSDHVLVLNGWFFYESEKIIVDTYLEYVHHPDRNIDVSQFLKIIEPMNDSIKLTAWPIIATRLPAILAGRTTVKAYELWKAIAIAAMETSQQIEGKKYLSRITPVIFFDPHGGPCSDYYELLKYFKYPAIEATIREPVVRFMRYMSVFGIGQTTAALKSTILFTHVHSKNMPHWLTDKGFYVAKFEDLKQNPEKTLRSICATFNIPYTEALLSGKVGLWGVLFTNEKGEQLKGFDQRSVNRDISDMVTAEDMERLNLFYWPIHHYFRYPCANEQTTLNKEQAEALFSTPFLFETQYEKEYKELRESLRFASAEQKPLLENLLKRKYMLSPEEIRKTLLECMTGDCLNGFASDLSLPEVMFPLDDFDAKNKSQSRRLQESLKNFVTPSVSQELDIEPAASNTGVVYWITGLSGAGKTTIGKLWYEELKLTKPNTVFLDGDALRQVFGDDLGFTKEDRYKSAMRNARLCALLSKQGIHAVCCTISMFDSVREWNRANIPQYCEIFVDVSLDTLYRRDQKGLYSNETKNVAGIDYVVELPKNPDIILKNNGDCSPEDQIALLKTKLTF